MKARYTQMCWKKRLAAASVRRKMMRREWPVRNVHRHSGRSPTGSGSQRPSPDQPGQTTPTADQYSEEALCAFKERAVSSSSFSSCFFSSFFFSFFFPSEPSSCDNTNLAILVFPAAESLCRCPKFHVQEGRLHLPMSGTRCVTDPLRNTSAVPRIFRETHIK